MEQHLLILIKAEDIEPAETVAADLDQYRVVFFDPAMVDKVNASTLRNAEYLAWDGCPAYADLDILAQRDADRFDAELDAMVGAHWPAQSLAGWQNLNMFYFFMAFHWYSGLWREVVPRLGEGKPHIFMCDNPAEFYWPSFVPALLLLQVLRTEGISFSAVTYGEREDESHFVLDLAGGNPDRESYEMLTHIPTCFHDAEYFNDEFAASGKSIINITSKRWNVPIACAERTVKLMRIGHQQSIDGEWPPLDDIIPRLDAALDQLLEPYLGTELFRARQVHHLRTLYLAQMISYELLERFFAEEKPGKMVLSDHDAGYHGPLLSFAERHNIAVIMLPHSKVCKDTAFRYNNITVLSHPIQGRPLFNGQGQRLLHFGMSYPETFLSDSAMPQPVRQVGLLLNGISLNGVQVVDMASYFDGIRLIDQWCRHNGIALLIRSRPGEMINELLGEAIGIPTYRLIEGVSCSLSTFATSVDVCLMYHIPTSAEIELLRLGVPILNPMPIGRARRETPFPTGTIAPRQSVELTLQQLDGFVSDVNTLHDFKRKQFAQYTSLFAEAYALRRFLR